MTTAQLSIVCSTVLIIFLSYLLSQRPSRACACGEDLTMQEGQQVVVNTLDERSLRGVVMRSTPAYAELAEVTYTGNGPGTKMMGRARVPTSNIAFVQDVTTERTSGNDDH